MCKFSLAVIFSTILHKITGETVAAASLLVFLMLDSGLYFILHAASQLMPYASAPRSPATSENPPICQRARIIFN